MHPMIYIHNFYVRSFAAMLLVVHMFRSILRMHIFHCDLGEIIYILYFYHIFHHHNQ